jgi:hypothetical protein
VLAGVYFIPCLTANIVSLGQLEEDGHQILPFGGHLKIWDQRRILLAKVARAKPTIHIEPQRRSTRVSSGTREQCVLEMACTFRSPKFLGVEAPG